MFIALGLRTTKVTGACSFSASGEMPGPQRQKLMRPYYPFSLRYFAAVQVFRMS